MKVESRVESERRDSIPCLTLIFIASDMHKKHGKN